VAATLFFSATFSTRILPTLPLLPLVLVLGAAAACRRRLPPPVPHRRQLAPAACSCRAALLFFYKRSPLCAALPAGSLRASLLMPAPGH
jgi:hypothetical protein